MVVMKVELLVVDEIYICLFKEFNGFILLIFVVIG